MEHELRSKLCVVFVIYFLQVTRHNLFSMELVEVVGLSLSPQLWSKFPSAAAALGSFDCTVSFATCSLETSFEVALSSHCNKRFGEVSLGEHSTQSPRLSVAGLISRRGSLGASGIYCQQD